MILVDANILVYAYNIDAAQHRPARLWLERTLASYQPVYLAWTVVHAFLRLTTSRKILAYPYTAEQALGIVDEWLELPQVTMLEAGRNYWTTFRKLVAASNVRGNLVSDAHLAALAIEHDATLYTADRDFARFAGLRVVNPLAS